MPVSKQLLEAARLSQNTACVECGSEPLFGGMRCLRCFRRRRDLKQAGYHVCDRHDPCAYCYQQCGCRCQACLQGEKDRKNK